MDPIVDPIVPRLEDETRRRRRLPLFRHNKMPVRMLVPNFFTLLACAPGSPQSAWRSRSATSWRSVPSCSRPCSTALTAASRALLKAQSSFGAELDSLADFVNFGVAPAFIVFIWGLGQPARPRLDLRHDLRARHGAAARPLQRGGRRGEAEMAGGLFHRHADAGWRPSWCCCRSIIERLGLDGMRSSRIMLDRADLHAGDRVPDGFDASRRSRASSWASASRANTCCRSSSWRSASWRCS